MFIYVYAYLYVYLCKCFIYIHLSIHLYLYIYYLSIPTEDEAFITIKDHKDSFISRVECSRLINPAKNSIEAISKSILDRVNTNIRSSTLIIQWNNTALSLIGSLTSSLSQRRH